MLLLFRALNRGSSPVVPPAQPLTFNGATLTFNGVAVTYTPG